jgi:uncharacterized protein (DUF2249 family)/quercetin dioxygenase-like cupin family protein
MSKQDETELTIDVRSMLPPQRHNQVFKAFETMKPGQKLLVVNDHEPVHLLQFMKRERRDFDAAAYSAHERRPGEWVGVFKKKEGVEAYGPKIVFTSFEKERVMDEKAFSPIPVYSNAGYRLILAYFKAGQFIPVHSPTNDLILLVHSGRGEMVAGSERFEVKPGDIVRVPGGTRRGIRAVTEMEVMHLVSPPPGDADHEEVVRKLLQGRFE